LDTELFQTVRSRWQGNSHAGTSADLGAARSSPLRWSGPIQYPCTTRERWIAWTPTRRGRTPL